MKRVQVTLTSRSPLLMNWYRGEKPSETKPPRGKVTKDFIDEKHRKQWMKAAYHDGARFYMPAENIEAMLARGAARQRMKEDFAWAVVIEEDQVPLFIKKSGKWVEAVGDLESYYNDGYDEETGRGTYVDLRGVHIGKGRLDACRPRFNEWSLTFTVLLDDSIVSTDQLKLAFVRNCLGDYRPRFGRFVVSEWRVQKGEAPAEQASETEAVPK